MLSLSGCSGIMQFIFDYSFKLLVFNMKELGDSDDENIFVHTRTNVTKSSVKNKAEGLEVYRIL